MIATRFKDFNDKELKCMNEIFGLILNDSDYSRQIQTKILQIEVNTEQAHRELGIAQYRDVESYYFGCVRQAGHYLWKPDLRKSYYREKFVPWDKIDGTLAPQNGQVEGLAKLHHKDGWTAFSFWDRSVDTRGNSSSTFFFKAPDLLFHVVLALARLVYPDIFKRLNFEIVEDR